MSNSDSWIDLREIADLVHQLMPEESIEAPPLPPTRNQIPVAWQPSPTTDSDDLPSLDDLEDVLPLIAEEPVMEEELEQASLEPSTQARSKAAETLANIKRLGGNGNQLKATQPQEGASTEQDSPPNVAPSDGEERALFLPSESSMRSRLVAYRDWVRDVTKCTRFLITDQQGYSLLEDENGEDTAFISSALQLMTALGKLRTQFDSNDGGPGVFVPLGDEEWLCVLECETPHGKVCLSMTTKAPLSSAAADELTKALSRTLESKSSAA